MPNRSLGILSRTRTSIPALKINIKYNATISSSRVEISDLTRVNINTKNIKLNSTLFKLKNVTKYSLSSSTPSIVTSTFRLVTRISHRKNVTELDVNDTMTPSYKSLNMIKDENVKKWEFFVEMLPLLVVVILFGLIGCLIVRRSQRQATAQEEIDENVKSSKKGEKQDSLYSNRSLRAKIRTFGKHKLSIQSLSIDSSLRTNPKNSSHHNSLTINPSGTAFQNISLGSTSSLTKQILDVNPNAIGSGQGARSSDKKRCSAPVYSYKIFTRDKNDKK